MRDTAKFGTSDKRGRERTSSDPYLSEGSMKEPAICRSCHAVYIHKRWQIDPASSATMISRPDIHMTVCPACQKTAENYPEGILTLRGDYFQAHEKEIRNILENEEKRVYAKNPLSRIMGMTQKNGQVVIETTDAKLAERLGRTLQKAHSGELQIDWSGDPVICRATWERSV
jgi:NMD protein affecting ribosome stability and mRNA decay